MDDETEREEIQFEDLIEGLIRDNYGCSDDFIAADTISGLRNRLHSLSELGKMRSAGLGSKAGHHGDNLVRGDSTSWIEKESEDRYESIFLKKIGNFIQHLNRTCYTSINGFESHYASYEQDSFYKRHLDQFQNDNRRKYSVILYLNEDWQKEDGGMLSLYPNGGKQTDIAPIGGRMVFFKSDEMEHEVHPSHTRSRISIAGWLEVNS